MSPDLSASNGTLSIPPATGDSTSSDGRKGHIRGSKDGQLPSIGGGGKARMHTHTKAHDNSDDEHGTSSLPHIGGAVAGAHHDSSDNEHNNLPPIGIGKVGARKAGGGYGHTSNYSTHSKHTHASGRSKAGRSVANKHRTGASTMGKYKKYAGGYS
eukprot:scaffold241941_cov40-Prasinocladus_malaysianus.AAC.1